VPLEISFGEFMRGGRRFFAGVVRDVTERERAEQERARLLEREQFARAEAEAHQGRLQAGLEHIPEGVAIADRATRTVTWNSAARSLCPPAEEYLTAWANGSQHSSLANPVGADELPLLRALQGEVVLGTELSLPQPNGKRRVL